ncbi:hypothetical protein BRADI_2g21942v3 [Brachypodium distachyon]|uniref:Uncharacterized protein n=1 Tax=Brachypodium distachyon TaxID=15368 RepID=A0A2K2D9S8_BRADI|nr:hypothetical protein BRADI_2g21942v3 [Brachypodium distachyon]
MSRRRGFTGECGESMMSWLQDLHNGGSSNSSTQIPCEFDGEEATYVGYSTYHQHLVTTHSGQPRR